MNIPQEIANAIVDPKAYADGTRLEEALAWLRREAPLARIHPDGYNPFWVATKFVDIQTIERQNAVFLSGERPIAVTNIAGEQKAMEGGLPIRTLVQMDNPDHAAYRRMTQEWFMPTSLRKLEEKIREKARELVDLMAASGGECDFAKDIALLFPLRVIMEILGVPRKDEGKMLKLTQELFANEDPDLGRMNEDSPDADRIMETILEFVSYFNKMTEDRRKNPCGDLASAIANGSIDGTPIGELEAMGYYVIVATAGHDTTSNSISGGLWALCENPDQFRKLKTNPSLIGNFVEESIRWVTPVKHFMRTAAIDTELSGQKISKGDWLMLAYSSANRDESQHPDPFSFNIERENAKNLAFGFGPHVCLGQHLSRMEMRIFWEELLPRLESVELSGTPRRSESNFVNGPKSVPIRFRMK